MNDTSVASFIIRVSHQEDGERLRGRGIGLVRHIQSGSEERFSDLAQAFEFIEQILSQPQDKEAPPPPER